MGVEKIAERRHAPVRNVGSRVAALASAAIIAGMAAMTQGEYHGAGADSADGQMTTYTVPQKGAACSVISPIMDKLDILNIRGTSVNVRTDVRKKDAGPRYIRQINVGANSVGSVTLQSLGLPIESNEGSLIARVVPNAISTVIPVSNLLEGTPSRQGIRATTPEAACGLAAVVYGGDSRERWAMEGFTEQDLGANVFVPVVHRANRGINSEVTILNAGVREAHVVLTFRSDRGGDEEIIGVIPAVSSMSVDMRSVPKGVHTLEIAGSQDDARLMAAVQHTGPEGMLASYPGVTKGADGWALPLVFVAAGKENAYNSEVRVMKVGQGVAEPQFWFYDTESGARFGPYRATDRRDGGPLVLQEGQGFTLYPDEIEELPKGRIYSAVVNSARGGNLAVVVDTLNMERWTHAAYTAVPIRDEPHKSLVAPLMEKSRWKNSAIAVQNPTERENVVRVRFFNRQGGDEATVRTSLQARGSATIYPPKIDNLKEGFIGWAEIVGSDNIAAVVNTVGYRR